MSSVTPKRERQRIKDSVLESIAPGAKPVICGSEMYRVRDVRIHVRYRARVTGKYVFNINPNTLRAHYEVWICGSRDNYYLMPIDVICKMYNHPSAYPDNRHPAIRVVTVNTSAHSATYAAPSVTLDLSPYFCTALSAH